MDKLKACAHCGGVGEKYVQKWRGVHMIKCSICEAQTGAFNSEEKAIAAWNRRPE
jgi:Lar family restriction alleviation protein